MFKKVLIKFKKKRNQITNNENSFVSDINDLRILYFIKNSSYEDFKQYLEKRDLSEHIFGDESLAHYLCKLNQPEKLSLILEKHYQSEKLAKCGTPLHLAVNSGNADLVTELLLYVKSPDLCNSGQNTPLMLCIEKKRVDLFYYIISHENCNPEKCIEIDSKSVSVYSLLESIQDNYSNFKEYIYELLEQKQQTSKFKKINKYWVI